MSCLRNQLALDEPAHDAPLASELEEVDLRDVAWMLQQMHEQIRADVRLRTPLNRFLYLVVPLELS